MARKQQVDISDLLRDDCKAPITGVKLSGQTLRFSFFNPNLYAKTELRDDGTLELYVGEEQEVYSVRQVTVPGSIDIPTGTKRIIYAGKPSDAFGL